MYFGQFYFEFEVDAGWDGDLSSCFKNHTNGLCGTSVNGVAFFITGLHIGNITLSVNTHDRKPLLIESAEEIVEASIHIPDSGVVLKDWNAQIVKNIELPAGCYRIRYSATNFREAENFDKYSEEEIERGDIECYTIDLWPANYLQDEILKVTREAAKYWHNGAKNGYR